MRSVWSASRTGWSRAGSTVEAAVAKPVRSMVVNPAGICASYERFRVSHGSVPWYG